MNSIPAKEPVLPPHIFERDYYQRIHDTEGNHWWAVAMRDLMALWLDPVLAKSGPLRALDVGCGTGSVVNWLHRYSLAKEPIGIDYSAHALAFGREFGATALGLASASSLPFPSSHFDVVICLDTLQHVAPQGADQQAIAEIARALKPGGYVYLRTNSALGHVRLQGVDPNLYHRYLLPDLKTMFGRAGLVCERASYVNGLMSLWAMFKEYLSANRKSAAIGPGLAISLPRFAIINKLLYSLMRLEGLLIGPLGLTIPFGHSIVILARKAE